MHSCDTATFLQRKAHQPLGFIDCIMGKEVQILWDDRLQGESTVLDSVHFGLVNSYCDFGDPTRPEHRSQIVHGDWS